MLIKRVAVYAASLLLVLGMSATAQAGKYHLVGGGGQLHIGGGLPLPIQLVGKTTGGAITATGTNFPPLLIPLARAVSSPPAVLSTVTPKSLHVPAGVLSRPAGQQTLGQKDNNPALYAVGTNLGYQWPKTAATLNKTKRLGGTGPSLAVSFSPFGPGQDFIRYSNALGAKFGGPARFALTAGAPGGQIPGASVTVYALGGGTPGDPPCTHTALVTGGTMAPGPGNPASWRC